MSTYNGEEYIKDQIESILSQTYNNLELIVRDDGSTDSTKKILESYSLKGDLSWYSGENIKPALSFINLVKKAPRADYYAFSDQDDVWDSDKIEIALDFLDKKQTNIPILYCSTTRLVDKKLNVIRQSSKNNYRLTFGESLVQIPSPGCTYVFNNKARELLHYQQLRDVYMHDALLYKLVIGLGEVIFDKTPHISYRQHENNVVGNERSIYKKNYKRFKRFFFTNEPNKKHIMACQIKSTYGHLFIGENFDSLEIFVGYRRSFIKRLRLAFNKDIKSASKVTNVFLIILSILGKL